MNDSPLQLWHIVNEQKGRRARKGTAYKCCLVLWGFPMTWMIRIIKAPRWHFEITQILPGESRCLDRSPSLQLMWLQMGEADKANGVFLHTVLVPPQNSSGPAELKPTVCQEASIKISDTEIAQLATTLRPQRSLFYVKFWNQCATLTETEGETLWKIHE